MSLEQDIKAQFSILIYSSNSNVGGSLRTSLAGEGYEVFSFNEEAVALDRILQSAPHLVVVFPNELGMGVDPFIEKILNHNSEIQFLFVDETVKASHWLAYRQFNVRGFVPKGQDLESRIVWEVEALCTSIYANLVNEEVLRAIEEKNQELAALQEKAAHVAGVTQTGIQLKSLMSVYEAATSKEEIIDTFAEFIARHAKDKGIQLKGIFFRFLPTVNSLVATNAIGIDIESLRGVGGKLSSEEMGNLISILSSGGLPQSLVQLLHGPLRVQKPLNRPLIVHRSVEGVFVFWSDSATSAELEFLDEQFFVFANQYRILHLSKRVDSLDVEDSLTGLFNREQYHRKLDEEIARARRLKNAVSIIKMSIDHLVEHEQSQGMSYKDSLVRAVATLIRKTSRINDAACRTGENEFTLILPHCPRKGAAIRGERLRRMVEAHDFAAQGLRVTLSLGISEYPTLSKSSSELDRSAQEALRFIADRSGNKVCMFRAPEGFRPDYDVVPV